jgi:acetyltransferase EpsM
VKVLVLGAGGHGQVVADILRSQQAAGEQLRFAGYLDDREGSRHEGGGTVLGAINQWSSISHDGVIVAIGDNATRKKRFDELTAAGARFVTPRHPSTTVRLCFPVQRSGHGQRWVLAQSLRRTWLPERRSSAYRLVC